MTMPQPAPGLFLAWDSSALGKRYVDEPGSAVVDALFGAGLPFAVPYLVYIEVANIIRRHRNRGILDQDDFTEARRLLEAEVLNGPSVTLLSINDQVLLASIVLADVYQLNASDAVILYLMRQFLHQTGARGCLVAADERLLRAAQAEGFTPINPEAMLVADLAKLGIAVSTIP